MCVACYLRWKPPVENNSYLACMLPTISVLYQIIEELKAKYLVIKWKDFSLDITLISRTKWLNSDLGKTLSIIFLKKLKIYKVIWFYLKKKKSNELFFSNMHDFPIWLNLARSPIFSKISWVRSIYTYF